MRLNIIRDASVPRLAWCLRFRISSQVCDCVIGDWVDAGPDFVCEGVWSAPFLEGDFDQSLAFMGSGIRLRDGHLVVAAPCNTIECVYSIEKDGLLFFSNSLAFLLCSAEETLCTDYPDYESDIMSVGEGLDRYRQTIPAASGAPIGLHFFRNILIDANGKVTPQNKPLAPRFFSYELYIGWLRRQLHALAANASASERRATFAPIAFSSSGYDSAACAALAAEIGCNRAVVFETERAQRSDSGFEIVRRLGYETIVAYDEGKYRELDCADEFVAAGDLGTSCYFAVAENQLAGTYLLSGVYGDRVWDRNGAIVGPNAGGRRNPDLARKEFRLRVGFVIVTVPFIGAQGHHDISRISRGPEMAHWSIGGDYDRPIPRRILEEKGIPRTIFGMHKSGGVGRTFRFGTSFLLRRKMPPASYRRFQSFYRSVRKRGRQRPLRRRLTYLIYFAAEMLRKARIPFAARMLRIDRWPLKYRCSPFAPSYLFLWGIECMRDRYAKGASRFAAIESESHAPAGSISTR